MRNMSFSLTTEAFRQGKKDVTRRLGWANLELDEHFMAVEKSMGLKKGEKVVRIGECTCLQNEPEQLKCIEYSPYRIPYGHEGWPKTLRSEMVREGFRGLTPHQFVEMFCKKMKCTSETTVNRIEFARVVA